MCVYSNVMDHYEPIIPKIDFEWPKPIQTGPLVPPLPWQPQLPLDDLRKLIAEFKEAVEAAKTIDRLTGKADCEDPEKKKLLERVEELEKLVSPPKWIVVIDPPGTRRLYFGGDAPEARGGGAWSFYQRDAMRFETRGLAMAKSDSILYEECLVVRLVPKRKK